MLDNHTISVPEGRLESARYAYLKSIGITLLDPFATPVAEQEVSATIPRPTGSSVVNGDLEVRLPTSYDYFVPSPLSNLPPGQDARKALRARQTAFVYGHPGAGKTMLRLALEVDCRREPDHTLIISYILDGDWSEPLSLNDHCLFLAKALAVDLFIQIVEQFNPLNPPPTPEQIEALRTQIMVGKLKPLINRILDEPEPETRAGLGSLWISVRRHAVRRVIRSEALIELLQRSSSGDQPKSLPAGKNALLNGLEAARIWEFEHTLAVVDGVDTPRRSVNFMRDLVRPLLELLPELETHHLWLKFFLPREIQADIETVVTQVGSRLTIEPFAPTIGPWSDASLRELLVQRIRIGGSRRVSLDDLADSSLDRQLDKHIIGAATGSPRRLLQIVSSLIDAHIADEARHPDDHLITLGDWYWMRAHWTSDAEPPPVPALEPKAVQQTHVQPHPIGRIAMAEPYVTALYVGRNNLLDQISDWANGRATQDQVMPVVGSPGVGKSYLLHRAREVLSVNSSQRIVLWINLSRNSAIRGSCPDLLTADGLADWVSQSVLQAQTKCPNVHPYDGSIRPEQMIERLVQDLCEKCPGVPPPILIVDSFEEVDKASREGLEDKILSPIINRGCARILISYRDDWALPNPLKLKERLPRSILTVMDGPEALSQLEARIRNWTNLPAQTQVSIVADSLSLPGNWLMQLRGMLPHYLWNHPGINSVLLSCAVARWQSNPAAPLLCAEDLMGCIVQITQYGSNFLDENHISLLTRLATQLDDDWTIENLRTQLGISLEDLNELFRRGIVFHVDKTSRYMIAHGLRELLRAWTTIS